MSPVAPSCGAPIMEKLKLFWTKNSPSPGYGPPAAGAQTGAGPEPVISESRSSGVPDEEKLSSRR